MKAKNLFFLAIAICIASGVKAQFYDDEVYYFLQAGKSLSDRSATIAIVYFKGKNIACENLAGNNLEKIQKNLKKSSTYYEDHLKEKGRRYTYNSENSTSQKITYIIPQHQINSIYLGCTSYGNEYWTFDKDMSNAIHWEEKYNSDEIRYKTYYIRISIEDIMPKPSNRDFLYE